MNLEKERIFARRSPRRKVKRELLRGEETFFSRIRSDMYQCFSCVISM